MTDKVALVRLRAKNDQYDAAMKKSQQATESLAASGARFDDMGSKLTGVGSKINRGITLPAALAAGAAFKMANDFNTSFTQMETLAGVTAGEVDGLKKSVMDLSGQTAESPQELAKALYFIRSAGLSGQDALDALTASAKGSAIGLGETAGVADVVTSALNTYGPANLSSARAVDMLSAAVAAGKGEAADFAPQLGNLLPIAQKLGLGFDQVAGSVSFLTQANGDVSRSATMVAGVMQKLQAPTQAGREALAKYGLSADEVQKSLRDDGLIPTLQMLDKAFGGNSQALRQLFDDNEGFNGVLGLMRNNGKDAIGVIDGVTNSTGYLDSAFKKVNETDEFKFKQALAELQIEAVKVGQQLIPIFTDVIGVIAGVAGAFGTLPQPVQTSILGLVAFTAALGPIFSVAGNVSKAIGLVAKGVESTKALDSFRLGLMGVTESGAGAANSLGGLLSVFGTASMAVPVVGAAIGLAAVSLYEFERSAKNARDAAAGLRTEAERTGKSINDVFKEQLARTFLGLEGGLDGMGEAMNSGIRKRLKEVGIGVDELYTKLSGSKKQFEAWKDELREKTDPGTFSLIEMGLDRMRGAFVTSNREQKDLDATNKALGITTDKTAGALGGQADATDDVADSTETLNSAIDEAITKQIDLFNARQASAQADAGVVSAQKDLANAHKGVETAERGVTAAEQAVAAAHKAVADARRGVADATKSYEAAVRAVDAAERGVVDAEKAAVQSAKDLTAAKAAVAIAENNLATAMIEATGNSDAMREAQRRVVDAEHAVAEAQKASERAQLSLTQARVDAAQKLDDLARANRGAGLSEQSAQLSLARAQERLANLGADGQAVSSLDLQEAQLAVAQAQFALDEAVSHSHQAAAELAAANAAGVEGSDEVIAAHEAIANAANGATTAQENLTAAQADVVKVQQAANQKVQESLDALSEAHERVTTAADGVVAAQQRIADAKQGLVDAHDRVATAAQGVTDAHDRVTTALDGVGAAQQRVVDAKDGVVAANDAVTESAGRVATAQVAAALAHEGLLSKMGLSKEAARLLAGEFRTLANGLDQNDPLRRNLLDTANALEGISKVWEVTIKFNVTDAGGAVVADAQSVINALFPHKEKGGPVRKDKPYIVGEKGPEIFQPDANGTIIPNGKAFGGSIMDQTTAAAAAHTSTGGFDVFATMAANLKLIEANTAVSANLNTTPAMLADAMSGASKFDLDYAQKYKQAEESVLAATEAHKKDADGGAAWNKALASLLGSASSNLAPMAQGKPLPFDYDKLAKTIIGALPEKGLLFNVEKIESEADADMVAKKLEFTLSGL